MKRLPIAFLWDIEQACGSATDFLHKRGFDEYQADKMLRSAVERQLQNLGEALSQLSRFDADMASKVPRHRDLIGFRNVLVHGYAGLNDKEIGHVVHARLPALHAAVTHLIQELDPKALP